MGQERLFEGLADGPYGIERAVRVLEDHAGLAGYELRFAGGFQNKEKNIDVKYWGRIILIPNPDGGDDGINFFMMGTSEAPELNVL